MSQNEPPPEHRWKPGQSGNPSGTSKDAAALSRLARQRSEAALDEITRIMKEGKKDRDRLTAAGMILDRAYGRPAQAVQIEATIDARKDERVLEEARERARALLRWALAGPSGGDTRPPSSQSLR